MLKKNSLVPVLQAPMILLVSPDKQIKANIKKLLATVKKQTLNVINTTSLDDIEAKLKKQNISLVLLQGEILQQQNSEQRKKLATLCGLTPIVVVHIAKKKIPIKQLKPLEIYDTLDLSRLTGEGFIRAINNTLEKNHMARIMAENKTLLDRIQQQNLELERLAHADILTGIPNRLQFEKTVQQMLAHAKRYQRQISILFIDLNNFKAINDAYGHQTGDLLLKEAAQRLQATLRKEDFIARIGGDEFAIILSELKTMHDAGIVARKLVDSFRTPCMLNGNEIQVFPSIGIAGYPDSGTEVDEILRNADIAMYRAKQSKQDHYQYASREMQTEHLDRLHLEDALQYALEKNELFLVYQPIYQMSDLKLHGAEVLIRWNHPKLGMIPPTKFIPIAEQTRLIVPIGKWILNTACEQLTRWYKAGYTNCRLSVNLSPIQLAQANILEMITKALSENGIPPDMIEFELTEMAIIADHDKAKSDATLQQLHTLGTKHALDDFGTGYSSLSRLQYLPITKLKIDASFVQSIHKGERHCAIVRSVIALADKLGMKVTAEGIETKEQLDFLVENKCDYAQGYYFSKPMQAEQITELFRKERAEAS